MRRLCTSLLMLLPLMAAGPAVAAGGGQSALFQANPAESSLGAADAASSNSMLLPLWHADNGQSWALLTRSAATSSEDVSSLDFHGPGFTSERSSGFQYLINPRWAAHASVQQKSWLSAASQGSCLSASAMHCPDGRLTPRLLDSEIGATFKGSGYSVGMDVSATRPSSTRLLPRVVPSASMDATVNGLPFASLDSSTSVHARGRVALGDRSGIDLGASVGRIRLLPGNVLGIDTLGQKSLSFGVDSGSLSGHIVGRVIQPESGAADNFLGPEHRWTSIDLGITWQLPWQGSLSFGTQNLWSSGDAPEPKKGPKPDHQSRIPYVQYHQDF